MPGLIPLMLTGGNRSGLAMVSSPIFSRHASQPSAPAPASMPSTKTPADRLSVASSTKVPTLPKTAADWKRTIAELKSQHINRRFRACVTQCDTILENIIDRADIEPAYLISLHFYAATSLEMCTRFLNTPSNDRNCLLQKALDHYDQAALLIRSAEEATFRKAQTSLSHSSHTSRHSPSGSISSRASTSMSGLSTPALSVCSSEDSNTIMQRSSYAGESLPMSPPPARKEIRCGLSKEGLPNWEPYIRPDSPTLGFGDEYFTSARLRQSLPKIPSRSSPRQVESCISQEATMRDPKRPCFDDQNAPLNTNSEHIGGSFLLNDSASRYNAHLASLNMQLARHRKDLEAVMEMTNSCSESYPETRKRPSTPANGKMQVLERQARIDRLRKSGWQRKRFDPSRYEALRMAALADLN